MYSDAVAVGVRATHRDCRGVSLLELSGLYFGAE